MKKILGDPYVPEISAGNSYGSAFLKSLQTEKLPELDLLVREAIQNSSDAALKTGKKNFEINFTYKDFDPSELYDQLGDIGKALEKRYGKSASFLEIRDTKTSGLTGPYKTSDLDLQDHGNFYKLVFDTGINQLQDGSGGNWGFGKSVYYRVGSSGLVVYYSQIAEGDGFEERLIVTMVENEAKKGAILNKIVDKPVGRAWWGAVKSPKGVPWPVTDHDQIETFLKIFGLKPFKEGKTGTSIIVPFVDEQAILEDVIPYGDVPENEIERCVWRDSVPAYLEHAIQKWYAPRICNKELEEIQGGQWIHATVNGRFLKNETKVSSLTKQVPMNPFFRLVQDLYNTALCRCTGKSYLQNRFDIEYRDIKIRREELKRELAGVVAFVKLRSSDIYGTSAGASPYALSGNFKNNDDENEPIVMCARELGMIISYSIDGTWSKGVKAPPKNAGSSSDEYILAFFVPNVANGFKSDASDNKAEIFKTLGGYLRQCEDSDHASWDDKAKFKIISKIKNGVARKLSEGTKTVEDDPVQPSISRLTGRIGRALMPARGAFTEMKSPRKHPGGSSGAASGRSRKPFTVGDPLLREGRLVVPFSIAMGSARSREIRIEVQTESGTLTYKSWNDKIGTAFPVRAVAAKARLTRKDGLELEVSCDASQPGCRHEDLIVRLLNSEHPASSIVVSCEVLGQVIDGEIELETDDRTIECIVKAL